MGILVCVPLSEPVLVPVRFVQAVEVWFAVRGIDTSDLQVACVWVLGLEVDADAPPRCILPYIERVERLGVRFDEDGEKEVSTTVWWKVESPELVHLVDNRFDHDVLVLQDGAFRRAVPFTFVLDDVEFGQPTEVLADCPLVTVQPTSEVADGVDVVAVTLKMADEFEAALREDVTTVLSPQHEEVGVASRVAIAGELVLLEDALVEALGESISGVGVRSGHTVAYYINS
jgi:hypothetical protein